MTYFDFIDASCEPSFISSPTESEAAGVRVARMTVPIGSDLSGEQVAEAFASSGADVGILRYPSQMMNLACQLTESRLLAWQADTLMYFSINLASAQQGDSQVSLREPSCESEIHALVAQTFFDYPNHYKASPALKHMNTGEAYESWAIGQSRRPSGRVYIADSAEDSAWGIVVAMSESSGGEEVLLAGVVPRARGRGQYSALLSEFLRSARKQGSETMYISTQTTNSRVMRTWCGLGLRPILSINTVHIHGYWSQA